MNSAASSTLLAFAAWSMAASAVYVKATGAPGSRLYFARKVWTNLRFLGVERVLIRLAVVGADRSVPGRG